VKLRIHLYCILTTSQKRWIDFMVFADMKDLLLGKLISMKKRDLINKTIY